MSRKAAALDTRPRGPTSWPVYALLRGLSLLLSLLPRTLAYACTYPLAALLFSLTLLRERRLARRGRGALRNMRIAFPELDARGRRRLAWRYCRHVALLLVEVLRQRKLTPRRLRAWTEVEDLPRLQALVEEGRGVILATGHFGNWEVLHHVGVLYLGRRLNTLVRPCPEAGLQRWLTGNRELQGGRIFSKFGGLWPIIRVLKAGELVGLNCDENMRKGGLFVPFRGVLAATNPSAALLQRKTGAPIAVVTAQRVGIERFIIHTWAVVRPDPDADPGAEKERVTRAIAAAFERALEAYPEQWLWSLRRWETRPPGETPGPDGMPPRVEPEREPSSP